MPRRQLRAVLNEQWEALGKDELQVRRKGVLFLVFERDKGVGAVAGLGRAFPSLPQHPSGMYITP